MHERWNYDSLEHANKSHEKVFVVDWCMSSVCNFSCTYCPENLHDHEKPFPNLQAVLRFCRQLRAHSPDREVFFQFTGGEVTLWKDMPELLRTLREIHCKAGIISNGSRAMNWWQSNVDFLDHICLSYHPEFAKLDHFFEVAKFLAPKTTVHVNIMMWPKHFDQCLEAAKRLSVIPDVTVALQPLIINFGSQLYDYSPEQLEVIHNPSKVLVPAQFTRERFTYRGQMTIKNNKQDMETLPSHQIIGRSWNQWKGWKCYAGVEQLVVDFVGDIYRGWCTEGGKVGNINNEKIFLPAGPVDCTRSYCHCNLDIMTKKTKIYPDSGLSAQG